MMYIPFKDMLILHFLMGVGFTLFCVFRAIQRKNEPPRRWGVFGGDTFSLGKKSKWIQWYSWAFVFEALTSMFYAHTGLFYYELGMSVFEAGAMVIGAFVVDRLSVIMPFGKDEDDPSDDVNLTRTIKKVVAPLTPIRKETPPEAMTRLVPTDEAEARARKDTIAKENADFDKLTKGH